MTTHWDHSCKPSKFVVRRAVPKGRYTEWKEVFRGTYTDGMMYIKSLESGGMISFTDDYLPAMLKIHKTTYRALTVEKELRREIIKLKKEIKSK